MVDNLETLHQQVLNLLNDEIIEYLILRVIFFELALDKFLFLKHMIEKVRFKRLTNLPITSYIDYFREEFGTHIHSNCASLRKVQFPEFNRLYYKNLIG